MEPTLEELVEALTTSGEPQLNPEKLKQLKKICRSSDEHIRHVYHLLMTQLNQEHAEIRLSAFQIVAELFSRSHLFRTLLISNFQEFLELTVETDLDQPLPPPKEVAQKLKILAIKTIQEWHEKFGEAYKKLSLGYHFLKKNKKVDFQDVRSRTVAERKREEEKQKRLENIYKEKAKRAQTEMEEMLEDIQSCLTEMENCFSLLLPDPEQFSLVNDNKDGDVPKNNAPDDEQPCCSKDLPRLTVPSTSHGPKAEESSSDESDNDFEPVEESFIREHGLGSHKYALDIEISTDMKVNENEDNTDVLTSLTDAWKMAKNKYWPAVQSWIQIFTKAGVSGDSLKCAIDVKKKLEAAMKKHKEMNIECKTQNREMVADSDDEDNDFEEVPEKEGYEAHIPDHLRAEYALKDIHLFARNLIFKKLHHKTSLESLFNDPGEREALQTLQELLEEQEEHNVHKNAAVPPGRPIVSGMNGPFEPICKLIDYTLRPLGNMEELQNFMETLNKNDLNIRLTFKAGRTDMDFLDLKLDVDNDGLIQTNVYRKKTSVNSLLHATSSHPRKLVSSIPIGQFLRARRICSREVDFETQAKDLEKRFRERGYGERSIQQGYKRAKNTKREQLIYPQQRNEHLKQDNQIVRFITTYNQGHADVRRIVMNHWGILRSDEILKKYLPATPAITFRKEKSLKDLLTSSHYVGMRPERAFGSRGPRWGCRPCGTCVACGNIKRTSTFTDAKGSNRNLTGG